MRRNRFAAFPCDTFKVRNLFDGHTDGVINDHNYEILMTDIQSEQAALSGRLAEIETRLVVKSDTANQLERLKLAVSQCLDIPNSRR